MTEPERKKNPAEGGLYIDDGKTVRRFEDEKPAAPAEPETPAAEPESEEVTDGR